MEHVGGTNYYSAHKFERFPSLVISCRMFNRIISGSMAPRYLSSDNDPLFLFHRWNANLRILDVIEVKAVPFVENISIRFLSGVLVIWIGNYFCFKSTTTEIVFTEDSTELPQTKKLVKRTARSLAWTITAGKNTAVVYINYQLRLEY